MVMGKAGGLAALALVLAVLAYLGGNWQPGKPVLPEGETPVAKALMTMVAAVETYRQQQVGLPDALHALPQFPKWAVEWDASQYGMVLVSPKLEFFYGQTEGSYYIIARLGDEAWAYMPLVEPALTRVNARQDLPRSCRRPRISQRYSPASWRGEILRPLFRYNPRPDPLNERIRRARSLPPTCRPACR
jgi:hypothetical protein